MASLPCGRSWHDPGGWEGTGTWNVCSSALLPGCQGEIHKHTDWLRCWLMSFSFMSDNPWTWTKWLPAPFNRNSKPCASPPAPCSPSTVKRDNWSFLLHRGPPNPQLLSPYLPIQFSQFSRSVDSLRPHGLQHTRLPCSSPTPKACSNSCPSTWWCHPTISSSVIPFSSCLQSFPASGSFPVSQLFISGGQSTGASASASVLPMNIQGWFPLELTGLISLRSKGLLRVFSNTTVQKHQFAY